MPYLAALKYWKAIDVIQAREALLDCNVAAYPKFKPEERKRFHRQLSKKANPKHLRETMEYDEFAKKVGLTNG